MQPIKKHLEYANNRGVGGLHIFDSFGHYERISYRSWELAKDSARRYRGFVVNDSGEVVFDGRE